MAHRASNHSRFALTPKSKIAGPTPRPTLTTETVVEYLEWIAANVDALTTAQVDLHMKAAELTMRKLATEAQNKATQHTLVEDGVIAPGSVAGG